MDVTADTQALMQAVEKSMRELEKIEHEQWIGTKGKRADILFVAEAVAGAGKHKLPPASAALIEAAWGPLMNRLGYPTAASAGALTARAA
jgi:hypothetical protein